MALMKRLLTALRHQWSIVLFASLQFLSNQRVISSVGNSNKASSMRAIRVNPIKSALTNKDHLFYAEYEIIVWERTAYESHWLHSSTTFQILANVLSVLAVEAIDLLVEFAIALVDEVSRCFWIECASTWIFSAFVDSANIVDCKTSPINQRTVLPSHWPCDRSAD